MWRWLLGFSATRAATGWSLFLGLAVVSGLWYAYDKRGDDIADLRLELAACQGNPEQARTIKQLNRRINELSQERANDEIKKLEDLPNDCYELDGPSPLNRVRRPDK